MVATAGAIRAGRAFVELFADNTQLIRSLNKAKKSLQSFGRDVTQLGKQFAKATAVFATPFVLGAKVFAEFQEQGAFVSTMLADANKHMGRFNQALRDMSVEFGESTATLSRGLFDILSATIPANKAIETLAVSVRAARAGMVSTRIAGDAITTMLNSYSLSADRAADISDLLFAIVKRGKTTLEELAPVIGQVASIAASANVSLEEFGAALATMTRAGVRTENAVTSLRAIVSSFLKPTETSAKAARELGFELSSTTLATEGLLGVFQRLQKLSPEQISELFPNIRALKGVIPALKQMTGFTTDIGLMADRAGRTEEAFQKMTNTMKFSFNKMLQSGVRVFDRLGEAIAEPLERIFNVLRDTGKMVTFWIKNNRDLIRGAALGVVALGAMSATLIVLGTSLLLGSVMFTSLASAIGLIGTIVGTTVTVLSTMLAVAVALTLQASIMGAAFFSAGDAITKFGSMGKDALDSLMGLFKSLKNTAVSSFKSIADAIAAGDLETATSVLWATIKVMWLQGIGFLEEKWLGFTQFFDKIIGNIGPAVRAFFEEVFNAVAVGFVKAMNSIATAAIKTMSWVKSLIDKTELAIALAIELLSPIGDTQQVLDEFKARDTLREAKEVSALADQKVKNDALLEALEEEHRFRMEEIGNRSLKADQKRADAMLKLRRENAEKIAKVEEELAKQQSRAERKRALERDVAGEIFVREEAKAIDKLLADAKAAGIEAARQRGAATATAGFRRFMEGAGTARGTFNAQALLALQGPGGNDRIVTATEATAKATTAMEKQGRGGKNRFTNRK